jgi:hypothetical protein
MRRLDNSLEDLALKEHTRDLKAWKTDKTRLISPEAADPVEDAMKARLLKPGAPELNEIYSKPVQKVVDPLSRTDALKLK